MNSSHALRQSRITFVDVRPGVASCFPCPRCSVISALKAASNTFLVNSFNKPSGPVRDKPFSLAASTIATAAACSGDSSRPDFLIFVSVLTSSDAITHSAHPAGPSPACRTKKHHSSDSPEPGRAASRRQSTPPHRLWSTPAPRPHRPRCSTGTAWSRFGHATGKRPPNPELRAAGGLQPSPAHPAGRRARHRGCRDAPDPFARPPPARPPHRQPSTSPAGPSPSRRGGSPSRASWAPGPSARHRDGGHPSDVFRVGGLPGLAATQARGAHQRDRGGAVRACSRSARGHRGARPGRSIDQVLTNIRNWVMGILA